MQGLLRTSPRPLALLFVVALAISACTSAAQPGGSTAPSAAAGAPVAGGIVTIPITADPTLNPWSPNAFVESLFINRVIFEGKIASLRHFKQDVAEVRQGFECGIGIERFQDIKKGDIIEAFKVEKLEPALA